jgi:hypothetical protein
VGEGLGMRQADKITEEWVTPGNKKEPFKISRSKY